MIVRLFVLGVLYERDAHGYDIQEVARVWALERWTTIRSGSLYHALGQLQKEGLIVECRSERAGNRPTRTIFSISDLGREAFLTLLRTTMATAKVEDRSIDLALAFCPNLPATERVTLLSERLKMVEAGAEQLRFNLGRVAQHAVRLAWVEASLRHGLVRAEAEIEWNRSLLNLVSTFKVRDWSEPFLNL